MSGLPLAVTAVPDAAPDFDALFQCFYPRLARLLYRVTGDMGRAEEVAAEAFCRLHRRPPSKSVNVEGWLYRTGLRLALDQLRRERRRARYEALAGQLGFETKSRQPSGGLDEVNQENERQCVRRVLAALKTTHANLLVLNSEGLNYVELAAALDLKQSSVGTLLFRARQAFRKEYLKRYGHR
jgi:RNA polymerase sigma-70 factor (ECF subfamily)